MRIFFSLTVCFLIFSTGRINAKVQSQDEKTIRYLIKEVRDSQAIFIRNGDEHNSKSAADHLLHKYNWAKTWSFKAITVELFINKIASLSSSSKKEYFIKADKTASQIKMKLWLENKLKEYNLALNKKNISASSP